MEKANVDYTPTFDGPSWADELSDEEMSFERRLSSEAGPPKPPSQQSQQRKGGKAKGNAESVSAAQSESI